MSPPYDTDLLDALRAHPVARLVHFTPSRNLHPILQAGALRSSKDLDEHSRGQYAKTDLLRLDGHPDHVCCSLQYPNAWYWDRARSSERATNFPDWVCLVLDKEAAALEGTLFCHRNAASGYGAHLRPGADAFHACYADRVVGQKVYTRGPRHDPGSATDVQAEVLLPAPVPLSYLRAIVVPDEAHALLEYGRLELLGDVPENLEWIICPEMFDKYAVTRAVQTSDYLTETAWSPT